MDYTPAGYDDFDAHLKKLQDQGLLYRIDRAIDKDAEMHPLVRWQYRGGIPEADRKAFLFTKVTDAAGRTYPGARVAIGALAANRRIYALGMNKPQDAIGQAWLDAIAHPIAPRQVQQAPCQEVVITGDRLRQAGQGLDALPIPVSTPGYDTAPYFTAALWVSRDPDTGIQNLGLYRGNLKAADRVAVMMERSTLAGGSVHWYKYKKLGQPMPVAAVLGAPPIVAFTGPQKLPLDCDEITVAGALAGCPINIVKCKTQDLWVPAEAQVIVEGFIATDQLEPEGPFGESHGYMALEEYNFSMTVTAITRRTSYTIASIISQVTPCESSVIKKVAYEPLYLSHLRDHLNIKGVTRVSMHEPLTNLRRFLFISIARGTPKTEIWRALEGAASFTPAIGKFCVAIDEDIDPEDTDHVLWALAYRCNPAVDTHVIPNRGKGHGPEFKGCEIDSTMPIDATAKADYPPVALPKQEFMERARAIWEELQLPRLTPQSPWSGYSLGDTAPYFSAGLFVTLNPDTGIQNISQNRCSLKASDRITGMWLIQTNGGAHQNWTKYKERGEKMPVALIVGAPPTLQVIGPQKVPEYLDDMDVAGALAGAPYRKVKCKTIPLMVPADAQIIIEGWLDPTKLEMEAPFGESYGNMSVEEYNHSITVTAITRRKKAILTSMISQMAPSESGVIKQLNYSAVMLNHLKNTLYIRQVKDVALHGPMIGVSRFTVIVPSYGVLSMMVPACHFCTICGP